MPDNVGYTPGEGAIVAADEILGILYQRIKMTFGVDGVATDVSASNPMPVAAYGELVEAIEAMRMAIVSLSRSIGMAQVAPTTGRMLVDANANATQAGTWNITNLATLGGQAANSAVPSFERNTADNLRRNINVT